MPTLYQRKRRARINSWLDYRLSIDQTVFVALVAAGIAGLIVGWLT